MAIALHHGAHHGTGHHHHLPGVGAGVEWMSERVHQLLETVSVWRQRLASRHQLARLNERELQDIGLTRGDVWREIDKPFWRP